MSEKRTSYFNTLMFTIIAAIVSLLLLLALFFDIFKNYMPFIITVEVGIFLIITFCIYQIISNESKFDKYKKASNVSVKFTECPDYYIKKSIIRNGKPVEICSNEYIVQDAYRNKYIMKVYPANQGNELYPLPESHVNDFSTTTNAHDKYELNKLDNALDLPTTEKKCAAILGQENAYKVFNRMPLTGLKARCENLAR